MMARIQRATLFVQILAAVLLAVLFSFLFHRSLGLAFSIASAVMLVAIIHPLIICFDFAMSRYAKSPTPLEFRLNFAQLLLTIDREVDASMRGFCWAQPFQSKTPAPEAQVPLRPMPILFVHGYCCNRAIWLPFMAEAARRGYVCEAVTLEPPFGSIDDYPAEIEQALDALLVRAHATQAVLVGHSMGGLACRAWMARHDHMRAAHLVTLGSPHSGTFLAKFLRGTNVSEMRENSAWLAALGQLEVPETRTKTTSIYSYHDNIVAPQRSSHLEGAQNVALGGLGHLSLLYSPEAWDACFSAIEPFSPRPENLTEAIVISDAEADQSA